MVAAGRSGQRSKHKGEEDESERHRSGILVKGTRANQFSSISLSHQGWMYVESTHYKHLLQIHVLKNGIMLMILPKLSF